MRGSSQDSRNKTHANIFLGNHGNKKKCFKKLIYEINSRLVDNLEEKINY